MGGEALAGCQSACGGVNGQPSAHNTLWMSDTPRCTNERLQARLVRLNRKMFSSDYVSDCVTCSFCVALRLSCMQSTTRPGFWRLTDCGSIDIYQSKAAYSVKYLWAHYVYAIYMLYMCANLSICTCADSIWLHKPPGNVPLCNNG